MTGNISKYTRILDLDLDLDLNPGVWTLNLDLNPGVWTLNLDPETGPETGPETDLKNPNPVLRDFTWHQII